MDKKTLRDYVQARIADTKKMVDTCNKYNDPIGAAQYKCVISDLERELEEVMGE